MSNSLWFSRIFTLQSSSWFCFNYSFDCFLGVFEKDYYESEKLFYNHWIWKFSKFPFLSFPFSKFIHFKITTNSFIYSFVEQFLRTHFHKNNYRGKGYTFGKSLPNFSDLYTPYLGGLRGILYEQHVQTLFATLFEIESKNAFLLAAPDLLQRQVSHKFNSLDPMHRRKAKS